ncbi:hypothetical protein [Polyangium sp. 15x6]|uniref:hypothetical protein n=1 Tax=Polyangium sp. 15x6 TaxID=3042687 RepID=UPI00249C755B|nr:hypothetical protein [Polyangium sp. 15x6]MDI3292143.1 hypothetical protein [Polyangium sp. 15x6]
MLAEMSQDPGGNKLQAQPELFPAAFADAWSFVDSTWRIHELLDRPSIHFATAGSGPTVRALNFKKSVRHFQGARNGMQHLDTKGVKMAEAGFPVWGSLHWVALLEADGSRGLVCTMISGPSLDGTYHMINPTIHEIRGPIDLIELRAFGQVIEISKTYELVIQLAREFEAALEPQFGSHPTSPSDILLSIEFDAPPSADTLYDAVAKNSNVP